jgi:ribosomal protein L11 methyltransferase
VAYLALTFDADAEAADAWADALLEAGALSVDVSDPTAGTPDEAPLYGEPGLPFAGRWPLNRLTALFAAAENPDAALAAAAAALGCGAPPHEIHPVAEQDWVRATQAQFAPIRAAPGLWIVPSWCEPPEPGAVILTLDPGLAFGTGSHPTTRLCLGWLAACLRRGESVLDYGCGSGILAIAAARLGAARVVAIDIDPQAVRSTAANASNNAVTVDARITTDAPPQPADVVLANILAGPLKVLAPMLTSLMRPGGSIVLAGLLERQAAEVAAAYPGVDLEVYATLDGWACLAGRKR